MALAAARIGACKRATGAIAPLLVGSRVLVDEDALGCQIGKLLVAFVPQKQRLTAVTDENKGVMPE